MGSQESFAYEDDPVSPRTLRHRGGDHSTRGVEVALIIWFAFILLPSAPGLLFAKQSGTAFALVQIQHAIAMSAMGIVLTAYR